MDHPRVLLWRLGRTVTPDAVGRHLNLFLTELGLRHPNGFLVMIMDDACWHTANDLHLPENVHILYLPSCSPELSPVEYLWDEIREKRTSGIGHLRP